MTTLAIEKQPVPTVSVIIPVHNGGSALRKCLASVSACNPRPFEVIVVADGESDGSWRLADQYGFRSILLETQGGPARARNQGAEAARGTILFFIDADVTVSPNAIQHVTGFFDKHEEYSALIGSYNDQPAARGVVSQYRNLLHHFTHQHARPEGATFWGACGAIRKTDFCSIGGFDENYRHPSIEDIELGYRLKAAGLRVRLDRALLVTHLKYWNFRSMVKTDITCRAIPWTELMFKEKAILNDLNLSIAARLSTLFACCLLLVLPLSLWSTTAALLALVCMVGLAVLNRHFYLFLLKKRGLLFLVMTAPLHWLYFLYSGLTFVLVNLKLTAAPLFVKPCTESLRSR